MGILDSFEIGRTGLYAHSQRLSAHANNIANIDTPNYVRKIPLVQEVGTTGSFGAIFARMSNQPVLNGGVSFNGTSEDPTQTSRVYMPGHPDADKNGYIRLSNVNPMVDMADAQLSARAYEASLAVVNISKSMAQRAIEIGK